MGPRKQLAVRKRRMERGQSSTERRRKARHEREPSPEEPVLLSASLVRKTIASGRRVDIPFWDQYHFFTGDVLRDAGLVHFCTMFERFYPDLIREFYASMSTDGIRWTAVVQGIEIPVTPETLSRIWQIPLHGIAATTISDRERAFRCILERDDVSGITTVAANQLSLGMRVLHHIIARILIPKSGRFDFIMERELVLMVSLSQRTRINLPRIMLHQMGEAATHRRLVQPYGMGLTQIFREFGISFDGIPFCELQHTDTYGEKSLHRMGFRLIGDRWVRRESGQEPDEEEEIRAAEAGPSEPAEHETPPRTDPETEGAEPEPFTPPPAAAPAYTPATSRPSRPDTLTDVERRLTGRILDIRRELQDFRISVDTRLTDIESLLRQLLSSGSSGPPPPPPPATGDGDDDSSSSGYSDDDDQTGAGGFEIPPSTETAPDVPPSSDPPTVDTPADTEFTDSHIATATEATADVQHADPPSDATVSRTLLEPFTLTYRSRRSVPRIGHSSVLPSD